MDAERFDLLARRLGAPGTRRGAIGVIFAAALAPAAAAAAPEPAKCLATGRRCSLPDAERHGHRQRRKHGKHHRPSCNRCCSRFGAAGADGKPRCSCKPEGDACDGPSQCCGGLCRDGQCTKCSGDLTACTGDCVDLQSDPDHCGDCATNCANGQRCHDGVCICDGISCPNGCCDDQQTCQRGTSDQACGDGGAACQMCESCATCDGSTCAPTDGACCDGGLGVCHGATCIDCEQGQRCQGGQCICDATSCPDGCCDGTICRGGDGDAACGTHGNACQTCGTCLTCNGETCVNAVGVCCGSAATCRSGQCAACDNGQRCQGGQCICDATSCPDGCCDRAVCKDGTDDRACGENGGACRICIAPDVCHNHACCTSSCDGKCGGAGDGCGGSCNGTCPGDQFCDDGSCVDCKTNGSACPPPPIGSSGCCGGGCRQFTAGGDFFCCTASDRQCGSGEECCSGACEYKHGDFTHKVCA